MLRRSNSSSHIPVPRTNLFNSREPGITNGLRRAQSSLRLSQNNEPARKPKRTGSLERKSSITRLSKLTPLGKPGRGQSLLKTTPGSSTMSQRSCGSRITQTDSALKERKTIQKMSTDKHWVSEQFRKVQNFISTSQLFDTSMVKPENLKPPSIKVFVYVTSVLFREMFPNIHLTSQNYKEVIPEKLKLLRYPGTIAASVLKTVNTMHAWPQVIGMFGWLIDKITIAQDPNFISRDHLDAEERQKYLLTKNAMDYLIGRYRLFNAGGENPENIAAEEEEYLEKMANILDFSQEEHDFLINDILQKKEYKQNLDAEVEQLSSGNKELETRLTALKETLRQHEEADAQEEEELDGELERLEKTLRKVKEKKKCCEENIARLKEAIETQLCSYKEKVELLKRIEALKKKRDIVKEKMDHARKIKSDFDAKLDAEMSMLQNQVTAWNRSLMEVSIKKPYLKKLMLDETGFHKPSYLEHIEEVSRLRVEIETDIAQKMAAIDKALREKTAKKKAVEIEIDQLEKAAMEFEKKIETQRNKQEDIERVTAVENTQFEEEKEELEQELIASTNMDELTVLSDKESRLRNEIETLDKDVKTLTKKVLCFFVDLSKHMKDNAAEMTNVVKEVDKTFENTALRVLEVQRKVIDALKSLEEL